MNMVEQVVGGALSARASVLVASLTLCAGVAFVRPAASAAAGTGKPDTTGTTALTNELIGLERQSWEAWKSHDGKFFEAFLSDDHVEVNVGGISNKAGVVASVASPACSVSSYAVDHFKLTRIDATTALLTYRAEQSTSCNGNPVPSPVWATSLYVRRGGHWVNILYQQTPMPAK